VIKAFSKKIGENPIFQHLKNKQERKCKLGVQSIRLMTITMMMGHHW